MTKAAPKQLPLALTHPPHYERDTFLSGASNRDALALIERWPDWPAPIVVLSGPPGSGKTHLAHIWAARAGAGWLAADALEHRSKDIPARGMWVVEDLDGDRLPERALFHCINMAREAGGGLLLTARRPAAHWRIALPDLRSRLRMAAPASLAEPDEALLRQVLVKLFADRQLMIDKPVVDFLLVRMERSLSAAGAIVAALDREALAEGRRITRPMAAKVLAGSGGLPVEFADRQ